MPIKWHRYGKGIADDAEIERCYKSGRDFDFEEEKLSEAFRTLPLMKRRILTMLFVEQLSPREIASHLNCSVQYVYNQRSLALKSLRRIIANRSDDA